MARRRAQDARRRRSRSSARRRPTSVALAALPNVHLLGQRPHDEVPRYVKGFDVGIVPYRLERLHRQRLSDEAQRISGDGHSGRRDRSARDPAVQRRPRRRSSRSPATPSSSSPPLNRGAARRPPTLSARGGSPSRKANSWARAHRGDVGADRRGARRQRAPTESRGTRRCARLYRRTRGRIAAVVGGRRRCCICCCSTHIVCVGVAAPLQVSGRRRNRPTPSSSSPAAWASRARPAAATRSGSRQAVDLYQRRLRVEASFFSRASRSRFAKRR